MTIVSQGTLNLAALIVPGTYVVIIPPQTVGISGTPTNRIGIFGTAAWGPVGVPTIIGDTASYVLNFGTPVPRKYDMGTHVATAVQQGASDFRCVRCSDGSDTAAQALVGSAPVSMTFTAAYTGSLGNNLSVQILAGARANTWRAVIQVPGGIPEIFDNVAGTGNPFWVNLAAAINLGTGITRGPSKLVIASAGSGTLAPSTATYTLAGGSDGASGMTGITLLGVDTALRTGMYALRNTGCSLLVPVDLDTSTLWTTVDGFCAGEAMESFLTGPSGDTIANAVTTKQTAGLDSYSSKLMFGDFLLWSDPFLKQQRYVSAQGYAAGRYAALSPEQSGLNKTLYGIGASQKSGGSSGLTLTYSTAELSALIQAGIDVISNPGAGGVPMWTMQIGHNSSTDVNVHGDNYTRMTNYIATSLQLGLGRFLGLTINALFAQRVNAAITNFLLNQVGAGILGSLDGSLPFSVNTSIGPGTINPLSQTSLGIFQANVQVQYQAIAEKLIINLEGGQTVTIARQVLPGGIVASS